MPAGRPPGHLSNLQEKQEKIMSDHRRRSAVVEIMAAVGDALAVAAAVRQGRQPSAQNLRGLGIDPEQFRQIGRF
jgi:hypothetical protein